MGGVGRGNGLFRFRFLGVEPKFGRAPFVEQVGVEARVPHPGGDHWFGQSLCGGSMRDAGEELVCVHLVVMVAARVDVAIVSETEAYPKSSS